MYLLQVKTKAKCIQLRSVNHNLIFENSELNVFKNINVEGEIFTFILTVVHILYLE